MSFFNLLSEDVIWLSAVHEPWSIPPAGSKVTDLVLPTVNVIVAGEGEEAYSKCVFAVPKASEPTFTVESTANDAPSLTMLRSDNDEPNEKKSNTEMEEAM
jgi:hypothetical protein